MRIAVLTSGGDAPGMNAAIRAIVRTAIAHGLDVMGVRHGYSGLMAGELVPLGPRDVGGIIDRGGTILGSTRCARIRDPAGQDEAVRQARAHDISTLIVIGGNGSQAGALALSRRGLPTVGVASTIDNDLAGSDITIGAMTALDTALSAIDRLRVTASSHNRAFLVETMGRDCGYLALIAGIAGGAECIVIPEAETTPAEVAAELRESYRRGKSHAIVVVAEGARHNADALAKYFADNVEHLGFELRVTRLGHVQRGGPPGVFDRLLATQLGAAAVDQVRKGATSTLVGLIGGKTAATPLTRVVGVAKSPDLGLLALAQTLAR
ncbi:MAG TPA: ATP-dependent 6-phosphofructokinase [Steroidobacteraceae bacterium]|nr:ATP-dependent 6-phosphofructokinase [Steroidobacteraceae bacterium]